MSRVKRDQKSVELANKIISEYAPESVEDMENALKDIFGPMFESMLQGELNHHLGYASNDKSKRIILIGAMGTIKKYLKPLKATLILIRLEIVMLLSLQN